MKSTCYYCGKEIDINRADELRGMKAMYLGERFTCRRKDSPECVNKKQNDINQIRKELGCCGNQGKKKTKEELDRANQARKKSGMYERLREVRKGRTVEEIYGFEKGQQLRARNKEVYASRPNPIHLGHKHSTASRAKMSESAIKRMIGRTPSSDGRPIKGRLTGYYYSAHDNAVQRFDSGLEYATFAVLNIQGKIWSKNTTIKIPYKDENGHPRLYLPDILVWEDSSKTKLIEILEVKPMTYTTLDKKQEYFEVPYQERIYKKEESLKAFCDKNNITCRFFTEKDVYSILHSLKYIPREYITFTVMTRWAWEYLNGERDLYKSYQKGEVGGS